MPVGAVRLSFSYAPFISIRTGVVADIFWSAVGLIHRKLNFWTEARTGLLAASPVEVFPIAVISYSPSLKFVKSHVYIHALYWELNVAPFLWGAVSPTFRIAKSSPDTATD